MKKILFIAFMLYAQLSLAAPSGVVVSMKSLPACSHVTFWKQARLFKVLQDKTYYSKFSSDIYPSALITNGPINANLAKYKSLAVSTNAKVRSTATTQLDNYLTLLKKSIDSKYSCLSMSPDSKISFYTPFNGLEGLNLHANIGYPDFAQKYPLKNSPPIIYLVDTVINFNKILLDWRPRVLPGYSFVPGYPQPVDRDTGFDQHADDMSFLSLATSDAQVYPVAIGINDAKKTGLLQDKLASGIEHAIADSIPVKQNVINASWGSRHGNPPDVTRAFADAVKNNINVVQAIGNKNEHTWPGIVYDDNIITVGFALSNGASGADGKVLGSDFGNDGPDLVVNEDGYTPYVLDAVNLDKKPFGKMYSSGASAIVSGIVSRMKNSCPEASTKTIKESLCKTATKLTVFPDGKTNSVNDLISRQYNYKNSFVKCGLVEPMKAIDDLMARPECSSKPKLLPIGYFGNTGTRLTSKQYAINQTIASPNVTPSTLRSEFATDGTEYLFIALSDGSNDNYNFWHQCPIDDQFCIDSYNNGGYSQ